MAPLPRVKVYENSLGQIVMETANDIYAAAPSIVAPKYHEADTGIENDNRISLIITGSPYWGFFDYYAPQILNEQGEQINGPNTTMADIRAYFESLGIATPGGEPGGGYYTKQETQQYVSEQITGDENQEVITSVIQQELQPGGYIANYVDQKVTDNETIARRAAIVLG